MSCVALQIGQCGNQLGHNFFNTLAEITSKKRNSKNFEFLDESDSRFFSYNEKEDKRFARAVLLDTEAKVIKDIIKPAIRSSFWSYKDDSYKMLEMGSGNNWAMGFKYHGPVFHDFLMDSVRKEVECCDQLHGFLLFGSVAGGSGSGLGSYALEILRDEFPSVSSASVSIWPFQKGEVSVQAYNAVLSLAVLQNYSDAILVFENDWLLKLCNQRMGIKDASMWDLNSVASQQLASLLLPVENHGGINPNLNDVLAHLVPHPQFKLVGLRSVPQEPLSSLPFSSYTWPGLLRSLRRMLLYSTVVDEVYGQNSASTNIVTTPPISVSNLLVLRGRDCETADMNFLHKPSLPYASWVPSSSRTKMWHNPNSFLSHDKTALLANNGQLSVSCVDKATAKAWKMFSYKAYFHHYKEYGLTEEDFMASVMTVEQIISSYKHLAT